VQQFATGQPYNNKFTKLTQTHLDHLEFDEVAAGDASHLSHG